MERMIREINCPFCLSILTKVSETKKPGILFFQCIACSSKFFVEGEKLVKTIGTNYSVIKEHYKTEHIKELIDVESPPKDLQMRCPLCQGPITIKKCEKKPPKKEQINEKKRTLPVKDQSFYISCLRGCGRGFVPIKSMETWRKTTSLLNFF